MMNTMGRRGIGITHESRDNAGISLVNVLLAASVAAIIAFTLAAMTSTNLNLALHRVNAQDALYLAEAAISRCVAHIHATPNFGAKGEEIRFQPGDRRLGIVTFHPGGPFPVSSTSIKDDGTGGTATLVATGQSHGITRTVEVLVGIPPFPYVIGTAGTFTCPGGITVQGINGGPANVESNRDITITGSCEIVGDAVAAGKVDLPPGARVHRKLPGSRMVELPDLDLSKPPLDTLNPLNASSSLADKAVAIREDTLPQLQISGAYYSKHSLTIEGDLALDHALLYVSGDLTITKGGAMLGTGAVIVTGKTSILNGHVDLNKNADTSSITLLGEGDVTFTGSAADYAQHQKFFQGLVYTRGDFKADQVQIVGAFIMAPPEGAAVGATSDHVMTLDEVGVSYDKRFTQVVLDVRSPGFSYSDLVSLQVSGITLLDKAPDRPGFVSDKFPEIRDRLMKAVNAPFVGKPFGPQQNDNGQIIGNAVELKITPQQRAEMFPDYYSQHPDINLSFLIREFGDANNNDPLGGHLLITLNPQTGKFEYHPSARVTNTANNNEVSLIVAEHEDKSFGPTHYGWDGADEARVNEFGQKYYNNPNLYRDMVDAETQSQQNLVNELNDILQKYGVVTSTNTSMQYVQDLNLNKFMTDNNPVSIMSWRER